MANLKDFATGTVASAPSPATSGTQLTLNSGEAARMPEVPFYATAHPDYQLPTLDNAEKILVTAKNTTTNVITFTRAQGDTTAKSIAIGWRISNAVFKDDLLTQSLVTGETPSGSINGSNTAFTIAGAFTPNSLRVFLNGQRLKSGSGNDYQEGANLTSFTMEYAPATGDVLLVDYNVGSSVLGAGVNVFINQETPTGSVNGANTSFTTSRGYVSGTLEVYVNGLLQAKTTHVTEVSATAGTFTLDTAPLTGDIVRVSYQYALSTGGNAAAVNGLAASDYGETNGQLIADYRGWRKFGVTLTYASATTFTLPGDYTTLLPQGTRLWLTQTTSKYFYVIKTAHSAGTTTVTVTGGVDYTLANAAITAPYFSYVQHPTGFPSWFNHTPTNTGYSSTTRNLCRFRLDQSMCTAWYSSGGTSNSTDLKQSLPIRCKSNSNYNYEGVTGLAINNGSVMGVPARVYQDPATDASIVYVVPTAGTGVWTSSGTKDARYTMQYEIEA